MKPTFQPKIYMRAAYICLTTKTACLLGAPLFKVGIDEVLANKYDELKIMTKRLSLLKTHNSMYLLRNALAIPKLQYIL